MSKIVDDFYFGLGAVIESNMDNPGECLRKVENYYEKNKKIVGKIRRLIAKNMEAAKAIKDNSAIVNDEEPQAIDLMAFQKGITDPGLTRGSAKYANALMAFTMKHPAAGLKISKKAIQFLPDAQIDR